MAISFAIFGLYNFPQNAITNGIMIGMFIVLSAGIAHDSTHRCCSSNKFINDVVYWFNANVFLGIGGPQFRDDHLGHHGYILTFDKVKGSLDRQNDELTWVQNSRAFHLYQ